MRLGNMRIMLAAMAMSSALIGCKKHEPVLRPIVSANATPTERYQVRIIKPKEMTPVLAKARYLINNSLCVPVDYTAAIGGIRPHFVEEVVVPLRMNDAGDFVGTVYSDTLASQDYYGLGECEWALSLVIVQSVTDTRIAVNLPLKPSLDREAVERFICPTRRLYAGPVQGCLSETASVDADDSPLSVSGQLFKE